LAHGDRVAFFDQDLDNFAGGVGRHVRGGFIGFNFQEGLVFGDGVAHLDEQFQDFAGFDTIAQARQFDFAGHQYFYLSRDCKTTIRGTCVRVGRGAAR
jgi:hypothetical protein